MSFSSLKSTTELVARAAVLSISSALGYIRLGVAQFLTYRQIVLKPNFGNDDVVDRQSFLDRMK